MPAFFGTIGPYLPLTYLISAYRVSISGGQLDHYLHDMVILLAIGAGAVALLIMVVRRRQQFSIKDLT